MINDNEKLDCNDDDYLPKQLISYQYDADDAEDDDLSKQLISHQCDQYDDDDQLSNQAVSHQSIGAHQVEKALALGLTNLPSL